MNSLLMALLMAVSPAVVAYSGTFVEDFNDENLDGWHLLMAPAPPFFPIVDLLKFNDGYLVIDPIFRGQRHFVSLELRTGNAEKWDSYTLTCRIRFELEKDPELPISFNLAVRSSEGPRFKEAMKLLLRTTCKQCGFSWPPNKKYMSSLSTQIKASR